MERPIIFAVLVVLLMTAAAAVIEYFIPLNARFEMNCECRRALLLVEQKGELTSADRTDLKDRLTSYGFKNIIISVTGGSIQGSKVTLRVQADFEYKKLVDMLARNLTTQRAIYDKTTTIRKVIN